MNKYSIAWLLGIGVLTMSAHGQGSLTPPGAPDQTFRTLLQVEPRIPIGAAPATITQSGSYYLTTNLLGTLTIAAHNVSLDLMGFGVIPPTGNALSMSGVNYSNVLVRNGFISAVRGNGADFSTVHSSGGVLEDLRIGSCTNFGLALGSGFIVRNCEFQGCRLAAVKGGGPIEVVNCRIRNCGAGLDLAAGSSAVGNTIVSNAGDGIKLSGAGSYMADNRVWGNGDNYDIASGNQLNLWLSEVPESIDWPAKVVLAGSLTCWDPPRMASR